MMSLSDACKKGNYRIVKKHIDNGTDVREHSDLPIRYACRAGHLDIVKLLLSYGADPTTYNNQAFSSAFDYRHLDVLQCLNNHLLLQKLNQLV
jgi:ankyrin repeat protein